MYDSVGFYMHLRDNLDRSKYLSNVTEMFSQNTGEIMFVGNLKNLKVKCKDDFISIKGSLPKYYRDNDIRQISKKDIAFVIEKISDELNLSLKEANVFGLEFSVDLLMDRNLKEYFDGLGQLKFFKRSDFGNSNTISYRNHKRMLYFYNKVKELKRKKQLVSENYKEKNLLRYELRFLKKLKEYFNYKPLAKDLYSSNFYLTALELWHKSYFDIEKKRILTVKDNQIEMANTKNLINYLALIGLNKIGKNEVLNMIDLSEGNISKMQRHRSRTKIKELDSQEDFTQLSPAIEELDRKINDVFQNTKREILSDNKVG